MWVGVSTFSLVFILKSITLVNMNQFAKIIRLFILKKINLLFVTKFFPLKISEILKSIMMTIVEN